MADDAFPFVIPNDAAPNGTAIDVSRLNTKPAGANGFITTRNGVFVESDTGRRIRFFATNMGAGEAFPTKEDADAFAAHLSKKGINLVRLHHLDNNWMYPGGAGTIWDNSEGKHQAFNPVELDKLDYLIAALKRNGIYVNINLKVSKELAPEDGFPESIKDIGYTHQKRVDRFEPRMIELQKQYARDLLGHVNPYTGLRYADDPVVAFVEINNENSIMHEWPGQPLGGDWDRLPEPFKSELVRQWNVWLGDKYDSEARLIESWTGSTQPLGASVVPEDPTWVEDEHNGTTLDITPANGGAVIDVTNVTGTDWHAQALITGLTIENGDTYTLRFTASAPGVSTFNEDKPKLMRFSTNLDIPEWTNLGLNNTVTLNETPRVVEATFVAQNAIPDHARISFSVGNDVGKVVLEDIELMPGAPTFEMGAGETLADGTIGMPTASTPNQRRDWIAFLTDTELAFTNQMRDLIRNEIGVRVPIADSQVQWGGATAYVREADSDFIDTHAYWQHPQFGGEAWDPNNWTIENSSMIAELARGRSGSFGLAKYRVAGKPFTVSEYDHPAPSDFTAEYIPLFATFGAAQDWDALYTFSIAAIGADVDRITGFFDQNNNPAKAGFYPAAALIFRNGLIDPIDTAATLRAPVPLWKAVEDVNAAWRRGDFADADLAWYRVAIDLDPEEPVEETKVDRTEARGSTSPLNVTEDGVYTAVGDGAVVVSGFIGGKSIDAGGITLTAEPAGLEFGSFIAVTLNDDDLADSDRMLLTYISRASNQNMGWNEARTTFGTNWGHGPVLVEVQPATITLPFEDVTLFALDPLGNRIAEIETTRVAGGTQFDWSNDLKTIYVEAVRE
ncbi:MAG: hypothetical protein AAGD32_00190 [Planctomycetota bacterium]